LPRWFQSSQSPYLGTAAYSEEGRKLPAPLDSVPVGIGNNLIPPAQRPFTTPNLGAAVIAAGGSYASFSESLPYPTWDGAGDVDTSQDFYRRKHNPTINWINLSGAAVPKRAARFVLPLETNLGFMNTVDPTSGRKFRGFAVDADGRPLGYKHLPTVSIVVPNEQNDAHSASLAAANAWLATNIRPYADWARANNSLLIVTFDEDGAENIGPPHTILTLLVGPPERVAVRHFRQTVDHLNMLATVLDLYGALEAFKADFAAAFDTPQSQRAAANLLPLTGIFLAAEQAAPGD
jgi:hypothetical protein